MIERPPPEKPLELMRLPDGELERKLAELGLRMSTAEARWLLERVGRDLTLSEATFFDVAWSEHCSYKSSRVFLKRYLPPPGPDVVLGPGEDAGVLRLGTVEGRSWCLVAAHESHNHPSQVVPVEGAATGVGGIVRDVYCMGADVVGVLDQLRFGDPAGPAGERVVEIARGVVRGIWEYGNALGVPNLGGDTAFDPGYDDNCLVNVVALGVVPEDRIIRSRVPRDALEEPFDLILVGKPTDSSGMGGASFASRILDPDKEREERGAVQIHDPFLKRVLVEATKDVWSLLEQGGWRAGFKDLGAGGLGGASSELVLASGMGALIDLDRVPTSEPDLPPETVLCAETQERFVWAVPRRISGDVLRIYNDDFDLPRCSPGAGAAVVGEVVPRGNYEVRWKGSTVVSLPRETLGEPPALERPVEPRDVASAEVRAPEIGDWQDLAVRMAGHLEVCCREWIYRHYDPEVRGDTVLRPGDAEACVVTPIPGSSLGVAVATGANSHLAAMDPRVGGRQAVAEAVRNLVAVGAEPVALTDGLNFGSPEDPRVLWDFQETLAGMREACEGLGSLAGGDALPIISGNVSFYNESERGRAIPPTAIVAAFGRLAEASLACPNRAWGAGDAVILVRSGPGALGGGLAGRVLDLGPGRPWSPDWTAEVAAARGLLEAHRRRLLTACRDISQGGLLLTLLELLFSEDQPPQCGVTLDADPGAEGLAAWLLAEGTGYVALAAGPDRDEALACLRGSGALALCVGSVTETPRLDLPGGGRIDCGPVWQAWRGALEEALS